MTPAGLPDNIAALRSAILAGEHTVAAALRLQRDALVASTLHGVAEILAMPESIVETAPLAGVGLAHKDIFDLPGRAPGCGMAAGSTQIAARAAATVVQCLSDRGAPPLAMLVMAEHACGATSENPHAPRVINPLDPAAAVGGSSSGSAAAVAAGLCYGSLGTDTAGSIRMPAATCGVLGFKPGRRRLSRRGVAPLAPSLDCVGLITRSTADAMMLFEPSIDRARAATPQPWRLHTCWTHPHARIDLSVAVETALQDLAVELTRDGAVCHDRTLPTMPELTRLSEIMLHTEAALTHAAALARVDPPLNALPRAVALAGAALPAPWYAQACQQRAAHRARFVRDVLGTSDLLLTPALPQGVPDWAQVHTDSPDFDARRLITLFSWMAFVNYLDLPAAVFPVAYADDGRPICVQAIARPGGEATLLAFSADIERRRFDSRGFTPAAGLPAVFTRR